MLCDTYLECISPLFIQKLNLKAIYLYLYTIYYLYAYAYFLRKCTPIPHDEHLYQLVPMGTKLVKNLMFLDRIY